MNTHFFYFSSTSLAMDQVVDRYIPARVFYKHSVEEWYNLIVADAKQIEEESGKLSRSMIVAYVVDIFFVTYCLSNILRFCRVYCAAVRQLPLYGSAVFRVQHVGQWALPAELGT